MSTSDAVKPRVVDRIFGPSPREQMLDRQIEQIEQAFAMFANKHENFMIDLSESGISVHEGLAQIDMMLDAQGWTSIWEYDDDRGLTLRQIKEASRQLRELRVGNPYINNGYRIRNAQTWGGGCDFSSRLLTRAEVKPLPTEYQRLITQPWAQRYIFGNKAHGELESAVFTDGVILLLGRDSDKRMQRIQIQEISGLYHNPNNSEEIWAYRRTWNPDPQGDNAEMRTRWYYTDMVPARERRRVIRTRGGQRELAETEYTLIDMHFNRQIGWGLGVPDALCVVAWARLYKEFLVNGYVMSRSLARLAYKVTVASAQGAQNTATTVATPGQSGSTYIEGAGNALTPLATAGKGYDFGSGAGLGSAIAAGLGVSWDALTATPSAGSAGAASALDPIAKATAAVRRSEWDDEFVRLFRYFGMDRQLVVTWHDLPEETLQRQMQAWALVDQTELFSGETLQRGIARVMGIADPGALPSWWKPTSQRGIKDPTTSGASGSTRGSGQGDGERPDGASVDDHDDDN